MGGCLNQEWRSGCSWSFRQALSCKREGVKVRAVSFYTPLQNSGWPVPLSLVKKSSCCLHFSLPCVFQTANCYLLIRRRCCVISAEEYQVLAKFSKFSFYFRVFPVMLLGIYLLSDTMSELYQFWMNINQAQIWVRNELYVLKNACEFAVCKSTCTLEDSSNLP